MAKAPPKGGGGGCISCRCIAKYVFAPFILLWQAFRIYVLGCFGAYLERLGRGVFCGLCVCCNCTYKDKRFPHDHRSIGVYKGKQGPELDKQIKWRRIGEVVGTAPGAVKPKGPKDTDKASSRRGMSSPQARLFADGIQPTDICQGALGDCWLLSALACLACQPGAIEQVWLTREYTMYGRYRLRLYDGARMKWRTVVVDDYIPCDATTGQPLFAKPRADEAWVVLLEKAMAKFMGGSYAALDGNLMIKALEILTGDFVCMFRLGDTRDARSKGRPRLEQRWTRLELPRSQASAAAPADDIKLFYAKDDPFDHDLMYRSIKYELGKGSTIGASNSGGKDTENINGIVQGHAYALMQAEEVEGRKFLRLRNPWGKFEWKGAWADGSPQWNQHPKIKAALEYKPAEDGAFWMEWPDFINHFSILEFCCRSTGFDHVVINIHEEHPCCGPCWGCLEGCFRYWLCCLGCKALCCGRKVYEFERPPEGCCGCIA